MSSLGADQRINMSLGENFKIRRRIHFLDYFVDDIVKAKVSEQKKKPVAARKGNEKGAVANNVIFPWTMFA